MFDYNCRAFKLGAEKTQSGNFIPYIDSDVSLLSKVENGGGEPTREYVTGAINVTLREKEL